MSIESFLRDSPPAERIKLPTRIVVHSGELSSADVAAIKTAGQYTPADGRVCELQVNGAILAREHVIRRRGRAYFKVTEMEVPS